MWTELANFKEMDHAKYDSVIVVCIMIFNKNYYCHLINSE